MKKNIKCPYGKDCGACHINDCDYSQNIAVKQEKLNRLYEPFKVSVNDIIADENPYNYRYKVIATFQKSKKRTNLGIYQENSHKVVAVKDCLIQNTVANEILITLENLVNSFKIEPYNEQTGYGLIRHVLIRTGYNSKEVLVCLVCASERFPSRKNLVNALLKKHPNITTVTCNINNRDTSIVLGNVEKTIYGPGFIYDTLCGKKFRISSKSFYQVNPKQTEVLYKTAIDLANINKNETILDCYSGIGTITLVASDNALKVTGVELNQSSIEDAIKNQQINKINNVEFIKMDATEFMLKQARYGNKYDVVILDPPRDGSTDAFINSLGKLIPERVVYISCNPETQVRDLKTFVNNGYKILVIQPVDLFPFTDHVESVVLMMKK